MSRIGKAPINIPDKVDIKVSNSNVVTVKGPNGELSEQVDPDLEVKIEDGTLSLTRPTDQKRHASMHGLYRSLINNMVIGVTEGYKIELELIGVGFRASNTGNLLELSIGYSHPVMFAIPQEVKLTTETKKGSSPKIMLESNDKQLVGQIAAKIRAFRKPEPYKGKGIRKVGEYVRRKAGKTIAK
jgi:large subunit ribosomal protein L6